MKEKFFPMSPRDVEVGKVFYLLGDFDIIYKGKISEVLYPNADYKAFMGDDGCRYGTKNCWVKKPKESE